MNPTPKFGGYQVIAATGSSREIASGNGVIPLESDIIGQFLKGGSELGRSRYSAC
jgi:hypothetical protein